MKSDSVMPLCVNVMRLQSYLLKPDEVVFFEWLIIKQSYFQEDDRTKEGWFYYPFKRINKEIRISRSRFEAIVKLFKDMGFLETKVEGDYKVNGRATFYKVNFTNVLACLDKIINAESNEYYSSWKDYIKQLSKGKKPSKRCKEWKEKANEYFSKLVSVYNRRIELYNEDTNGKRKKSKSGFAKSDSRLRKIFDMVNEQGETEVYNAFTAFSDAIINGNESARHPINLFTSKGEDDDYPVFSRYLDHFNENYGYGKI